MSNYPDRIEMNDNIKKMIETHEREKKNSESEENDETMAKLERRMKERMEGAIREIMKIQFENEKKLKSEIDKLIEDNTDLREKIEELDK